MTKRFRPSRREPVTVPEIVALVYSASAQYSRCSHVDTIDAVGEMIDFCIKKKLRWHRDDYGKIVKEYRGLDCSARTVGFGDQMHALAVRSGNDSAAASIDHYYRQKAVWGQDREGKRIRLSVGSHFYVGGALVRIGANKRLDGAESWWLSGLPHDADPQSPGEDGKTPLATRIRAVQYSDDNRTKVAKRRKFGPEELLPPEVAAAPDEDANGQ